MCATRNEVMQGHMLYYLQEATIWKAGKEDETLSNNVANVLAANMKRILFYFIEVTNDLFTASPIGFCGFWKVFNDILKDESIVKIRSLFI